MAAEGRTDGANFATSPIIATYALPLYDCEMTAPNAEAEHHHRIGFQLLTEGSYTESRAEFFKAIGMCPDFPSAYLGL